MARPKFFRDPVHGQIGYDAVDLAGPPPLADARPDAGLSWLIRRLIDCPEFQRLRHIRQNGLVNLVYHGAENSRFGHSMGVCHLAREMYQRIVRNMGEPVDSRRYLATSAAALLHDIGHGPFSHVLEEILTRCGVPFNHEWMTRRLILEAPESSEKAGASVHATLKQIDGTFPEEVALYINKKWRDAYNDQHQLVDHWSYKIVSSQMDADRLDYLLRDSYFAGIKGHSFDIQRLLDMLHHLDHTRIAVHRRAIEPVEGYLLALDQMYRTVYYHHTARAASVLFGCALRRAFDLYKAGARDLFPTFGAEAEGAAAKRHPMAALFDEGQEIPLAEYLRLTDFQVYALLEQWQHHRDAVLSDLTRRLFRRDLFKAIDVDPHKYNTLQRLQKRAEELVRKHLSHVDRATVQYYVCVDEPERLSYKRYDWRNENPDESIWIVDGSNNAASAVPIEKEQSSIIAALQTVKYFHRLMVPAEVRGPLLAANLC